MEYLVWLLVIGLVSCGAYISFLHWKLNRLALVARVPAPKVSKSTQSTQRAVLKAQIGENFTSMLPGFPYAPADFNLLHGTADFMVFSGLSTAREEGDGGTVHIVIGDIKSGKAQLSHAQRLVKSAVEQGRVSWATLRLNDDYTISKE